VTKASERIRGILYVVATPIGNLADLSPRARDVLGRVGLIAAEDTRHSGQLLAGFDIRARLVSLHEHNERSRIPELLSELESGGDIALISDAGTPLISDPGYALVAAARDAGIRILSVPGPSAVTAALSIAGLATDRFAFEGFLPRRKSQREARLRELAGEARTLVFFESVHRIRDVLGDLARVFGAGRRALIGRELTKLHEQSVAATLGELEPMLGESVPLKGEFVVVVEGASAGRTADEGEILRVYTLLSAAVPPSRAAALTARICGCSRNEVYALARSG